MRPWTSFLRVVDLGDTEGLSGFAGVSAKIAQDAPSRTPMWSRRAALPLAAGLFVVVFLLRAADPIAGNVEGILFVLPISLLALSFGLRGGVAGGLLGCGLISLWAQLGIGGRLGSAGYVNRDFTFLALGGLLGSFVDQRRRLEAERIRSHDAAEQRLAENARALESMIAERTAELDAARAEMLRRLAIAAEYRDDETFQHTERVGELAARIAVELGFSTAQVRVLRAAAPLHDIGKLAIPDNILLKRGKLSQEEFKIIKTHTIRGAHLLSGSSSSVLQRASAIALSHHERWDGTGYPQGLAGERISLAGRIVAVADVFDALTHERPYKPAWTRERAIAEIRGGSGTQFDPAVVEAFLRVCADPRFEQAKHPAGGRDLPDELARAEDPPLAGVALGAPRSGGDLVGIAPTAG
jgi:putative nucleotidyltransferase with HDIG domain